MQIHTTVKEGEWVVVPCKQPLILSVHFALVPLPAQLGVWVDLGHRLLDYLTQRDGKPDRQLVSIALVMARLDMRG